MPTSAPLPSTDADDPDSPALRARSGDPRSDDGSSSNSSSGSSSSGSSFSGSSSSGSSSSGSSSGDSSQDDSSGSDDGQQEQDKNWLEWTVFAVGVGIVGFVIGFLTYQLVSGSDEPPTLRVEMGDRTERERVVEVDVTVHNSGDTVAEAAVIEVCGGPDTCAQISFPYIPAGSSRTGVVGLNLPLAGPLETRAVSFRTP